MIPIILYLLSTVPVTTVSWYLPQGTRYLLNHTWYKVLCTIYTGSNQSLSTSLHGATVVNLRHCTYFPHILQLAEWQWNSSIVRVRISLQTQVDFQLWHSCIYTYITTVAPKTAVPCKIIFIMQNYLHPAKQSLRWKIIFTVQKKFAAPTWTVNISQHAHLEPRHKALCQGKSLRRRQQRLLSKSRSWW